MLNEEQIEEARRQATIVNLSTDSVEEAQDFYNKWELAKTSDERESWLEECACDLAYIEGLMVTIKALSDAS